MIGRINLADTDSNSFDIVHEFEQQFEIHTMEVFLDYLYFYNSVTNSIQYIDVSVPGSLGTVKHFDTPQTSFRLASLLEQKCKNSV